MDYAAIFREYRDDVYRLAICYTKSREDAEDVCQSVFMKLLSGKRPPQAGREKPWLLTCTANASKDRLRAFGRKRTAAEVDGVVIADDLQRDVWAAVRSLKPKYRAVVHLYYYEGYAQDEIAEILHISRTAGQTRMSRAREKLKEVLKDE